MAADNGLQQKGWRVALEAPRPAAGKMKRFSQRPRRPVLTTSHVFLCAGGSFEVGEAPEQQGEVGIRYIWR